MQDKKSKLITILTLLGMVALMASYFAPIWWVSLTAPNYPADAFPDGIRIHFHFDGVYNGCKAAGKGTRMKSRTPKVLHHLGGRALVAHVIDTAASLSARQVVVITGHGAPEVEAFIDRQYCGEGLFFSKDSGASTARQLSFARQEPQLGTGHAVQQAVPLLADDGITLVLSGDVPLTQAPTLQALLDLCAGDALALLTLDMPDPTGYGRIVRGSDGAVLAIVEHKDATEAQRAIREIYSGIMAVPTRLLRGWLARLDNQNAQNEYYLTDVVKFAVADGCPVRAHCIADAVQVAGVAPKAVAPAPTPNLSPAPVSAPVPASASAPRRPRCAACPCSPRRSPGPW